MSDSDDLKSAVDHIRVSGAVVLLGAGASYQAGMPLAGQLSPLVWHALDAHPDVLMRLASILNDPHTSAKNVVGDNEDRILLAFAQIAANPLCRNAFQLAFTNLNRDKSNITSKAHDALAKLIYSKHVIRVVSLNWDTLLESAFARRYGADINAQGRVLYKPHGDCADPDANWILPNEEGFVSDTIVEDLTSLADERPRTLFIIGYSEQDDAVARSIVEPLAMRWKVFRLGPHADGEGAIRLAAGEGLIKLADALCPDPEVPGWEFVTFADQRGIEAAVSGERLGPRDVDSCPRLPHIESAQKEMDFINRIDISGSSGCGKSITVWQLARDLNQTGLHVLRPTSAYSADTDSLLTAVKTNSWKSVLVIDDAQTFSHSFIERLNELATPQRTVITGTTDESGEQPRSIRIPAQVAVEVLACHYRSRRDELLPIVKRYDSSIGDEYSSTSLEWRIDLAAKSKTPWQFSFVLRSGWRQAREQLNILRDFDRADQLFVVIAARQLLSLDAGSDMEDVIADAQVMGRTENWAITRIELLRRHGLILPDHPLRCLHIQAAVGVIESALSQRREDTFPAILSVLRRMVYDHHAPVRGISWLIEPVLGADAFRYRKHKEDRFFESPYREELLYRLLASADSLARRNAAFLISRLLWYRELGKDELREDFPTLRDWFEAATGENCYALGVLANTIGNEAPYNELVSSMNPARLWSCVQTARSQDGYAWGHFLGRLAHAGSSNWRTQATQTLDRNAIRNFVSRFTADDLDHLAKFIQGIASFDLDFGLECVSTAIPSLQGGFAKDAFKAYSAIWELGFIVLGHGLFGELRPSRVQKDLSKKITDAICPPEIAKGIYNCRFGDWEVYARLLHWVRSVNRKKHHTILTAVSWDALELRSVSLWKRPPREFRLLLSSLTTGNRFDPVRSWIYEHIDKIQELDPILTGISPESAIAITQRGRHVNLAGHNESDWGHMQFALARVAEIDTDVAQEILELNVEHIVERLSRLEPIDVEELPNFLAFVKELYGGLLAIIIQKIDLKSASNKWPLVLKEHCSKVRRRTRRVLRIISEHGEGAVKELAESMLKFRYRKE